jgi:hypothetical protein
MWYENEKGQKWIPPEADLLVDPPKEFIYSWFRFPSQLSETCYFPVTKKDVEVCEHQQAHIRRTYGWIDGIEGRECSLCHGTQTRESGKRWPKQWDAHGSSTLMTGNTTWPADLVLEMARPRLWLRLKGIRPIPLERAILIATTACERCVNVLGHRYGLEWGYPEYGEEWQKAGTSCALCSEEPNEP